MKIFFVVMALTTISLAIYSIFPIDNRNIIQMFEHISADIGGLAGMSMLKGKIPKSVLYLIIAIIVVLLCFECYSLVKFVIG
jgi:hypothetical protein